MTFEATFNLEIIEVMEDFIERNRPPEHIRKQLDLGYRIDKQNIFLFEIRPDWMNPEIIRHHDFAKTTYNKRQGIWKVYWMRGNLKWYPYDPNPEVRKLKDFVQLVEEDQYGCFKG